jgi:hypothetical protein
MWESRCVSQNQWEHVIPDCDLEYKNLRFLLITIFYSLASPRRTSRRQRTHTWFGEGWNNENAPHPLHARVASRSGVRKGMHNQGCLAVVAHTQSREQYPPLYLYVNNLISGHCSPAKNALGLFGVISRSKTSFSSWISAYNCSQHGRVACCSTVQMCVYISEFIPSAKTSWSACSCISIVRWSSMKWL